MIGLGILLAVACASAQDRAASGKWEYKAVPFAADEKDATKQLNDLAGEEWEYVGPLAHNLVAFRRPLLTAQKPKVVVRASNVYEKCTPERAFDGDAGTTWNSGGAAPQWIEADLGSPKKLLSVLLLPDHADKLPGETIHEVWVSDKPIGEDRTTATLLHTFKGQAIDSQELKVAFPKEPLARFVQILTTQSPTWVAWREIALRVR
jgi:hypothetical protein